MSMPEALPRRCSPPVPMMRSEAGISTPPKRDITFKDICPDREGESTNAHRAEEPVTGQLTEISASETAIAALEVSVLLLCNRV